MNIALNCSIEKLRDLFANANDERGAHCLWLDIAGTVHLDLIPPDLSIEEFKKHRSGMVVCYEPFRKGDNYVGPNAAIDVLYLINTLQHLEQVWALRREDTVMWADGSEY